MHNIDSLNIFTSQTPCPSIATLQIYFHEGMLSQNEWKVESHLLACESCQKWLENYRTQHSPNLGKYLENTFQLKLQLHRLGLQHVSIEQINKISANTIKIADFLAGKVCQPIKGYETIIQQNTRSSEETILSPNPLGSFVNNTITFNDTSEHANVQLYISNNQHKNIYDALIDSSLTLNLSPQTFPNGLYYYKLVDEEEELITLGKFYVYRD